VSDRTCPWCGGELEEDELEDEFDQDEMGEDTETESE
jgi:hypothetical protein